MTLTLYKHYVVCFIFVLASLYLKHVDVALLNLNEPAYESRKQRTHHKAPCANLRLVIDRNTASNTDQKDMEEDDNMYIGHTELCINTGLVAMADVGISLGSHAHNQPLDSLITKLRRIVTERRTRTSSWRSLLSSNVIWMELSSPRSTTSRIQMKGAIPIFLHNRLQIYKNRRGTKFLNACRPNNGTDPILWLSMSTIERSRCVRWRIGWLRGGKPRVCPRCHEPKGTTRPHLIQCLNMHTRLKRHNNIEDALSWIF
ncbi:hypothetical protein K492DRAFT_168634 [Lichtheimia hyalospora FSU 10163]|nr:hypothetical protein K492DRAFT_168634 [Lichtheimia hyalospora FSU 10163]